MRVQLLPRATRARWLNSRYPLSFYDDLDRCLQSYKKETAKAKKEGKLVEQHSDPIPFSLYKIICDWAQEKSNNFVHFWTATQWNCVARAANVDPLGLHNVKLGIDSVIVKYDDSKADKAGEKLSEKNTHANPFDWKLCWWTLFGIHLAGTNSLPKLAPGPCVLVQMAPTN